MVVDNVTELKIDDILPNIFPCSLEQILVNVYRFLIFGWAVPLKVHYITLHKQTVKIPPNITL